MLTLPPLVLALTLIYTALFTARFMRHGTAPEEPVQLLRRLPVQTLAWFAGLFLPAAALLGLLFLILALLVAGYSPPLAVQFLTRAALVGYAILLCGLQTAVTGHVDLKRAQTLFTRYLLAAGVLSALFYHYYPLILGLMVLLPALGLTRIRYYQVEAAVSHSEQEKQV